MKSASLIVTALLLAASSAAHAGPAATLNSPGAPYPVAPFTVGFQFTLNGNANATKLGIYDSNGDGLEAGGDIGLWAVDGTLLASVPVGAGTAGELIGSFRYGTITPVALAAGSTYVVGSYMNSNVFGSGTSFGMGQGGSGSFDSLISAAQDRFAVGSSLSFPDMSVGGVNGMWAGGNVVLEATSGAIPEPESWALLIAGFGVVGATLRRRRLAATLG